MPNPAEILQFRFSTAQLKQAAKIVVPKTLIILIEHRINHLDKITESMGASSFIYSGNNLIPQIFTKFKESIGTLYPDFQLRELRTLSYSLSYSDEDSYSIVSNSNELGYALQLLEFDWRDNFLLGLVHCFLSNWEIEMQDSKEILEKFIFQKLKDYAGTTKTLLSLKNNKRFFKVKNGNLILGDTLAKLNKPLQDATKVLGVPDSWFLYPYFSKVIVKYYDVNKIETIDEIDKLTELLKLHNNFITNKRVISKIIIEANKSQISPLQEKIKKLAFELIGDSSNISNWSSFDRATENERKEIAEARNILEEWIAKQFIDVFFKVCINDIRRKNFWLKIASKNKLTFNVFGPISTKNILKRDERIAQYVDSRFTTVRSNREVSAFILYIGDYMLIEFSDEGYAFYAYKMDGDNKPDLSYTIQSVDELRNGSLPMLIYRTGYEVDSTNDEGRLSHNDGDAGWEVIFEYWLKNIAGINV